jgi:copper(I)-binding protein
MIKRPAARSAVRAPILAAALVVLATLAACGGGAGLPAPAAGSVEFSDAWVRSAPAGGMTAAYFEVTNGLSADDALTGVSSPAATTAGLHETTTDASGMMGMQGTDSVPLPAGGTVTFAPGGLHVMLMGLKQDLVAGSRVDLSFSTQDSGTIVVSAEVRDN